VIYAVIMSVVIYPVIVYWTWSSGWLIEWGYSDFAGSGIVHLTGGISALVGAAILGPRAGRFDFPPDSIEAKEFDPHNMGLVVLGTFILWFGWYGFNCGSTLAFSDAATAHNGALVAMNTTISAAAGGLTIWAVRLAVTKRLDVGGTCNGILAGLVAVCAGVGSVEPYCALFIGVAGGIGHEVASNALKKLKIDDPLDAFAVHGAAGIVGTLLRPLLDTNGADGEMFGIHIVAVLVIIGWSGGISAIVFGILRFGAKILRVSEEEEMLGADAKVLSQQMHSPSKQYEGAAGTAVA
jgi:Amt family ammonium transporter